MRSGPSARPGGQHGGFHGRLDDATWPEVDERREALFVIPIGSTEQHGPHLPFTTDADIAAEMAARLAEARDDCIVGPTQPFGASGEHQAFAGTISIGTEVLTDVLIELGRSATESFARVLFVNGHGGNADAVATAVPKLRAESRDVRCWSTRVAGGDGHAGHAETSVMLALRPASVRSDKVEPGNHSPLADIIDELRTGGVARVSPNGVLGDPTAATEDDGRRILDAMTRELVDAVAGWWPS